MTITTFQMVHEWQSDIAHDVLKLFFECKEHNMATNETIALLNEFLYPDYDRLNPLYEEYYSKLEENIDKNNAERIVKYFSKIYTELQDISRFIPEAIEPVVKHRDKRLECDNQKNFQNELNFNVAEICYIRAMESYKNSFSKRINYYTKAIEEDPEWAECYSERAFCYDMKRDYESAIADYQKALELFKKQDDEENCNLMEQKIKELESKTQC